MKAKNVFKPDNFAKSITVTIGVFVAVMFVLFATKGFQKAYAQEDNSSATMYFMLPDQDQDIESTITLMNPEDISVDLTITAYAQNGALLGTIPDFTILGPQETKKNRSLHAST